MGVMDTKYLSADQIRGFDNYRYCSVDTSPVAVYISHPFWNWIVEFFPRWLAPNVLTFGGMVLVLAGFLLASVYDYSLLASSDSFPSYSSVPRYLWLILSIFTFCAHVMDGTDGKQARRTGTSGPTGELFDHGIDSWMTIPFTVTIYSIFGRADYSIPAIRLLFVLMSVQWVFIVTHWEKYNTGILFLSWGYDLSQYSLALMYLVTFFGDYKMWKVVLVPSLGITPVIVGEFFFYASAFAMSVPMSLYNIAKELVKTVYQYSGRKDQKAAGILHIFRVATAVATRSYQKNKGKMRSIPEAMLPLLSTLILFSLATVWAAFSPIQVIDQDPRMFFWAMGTLFSNIATRLIIAQMSGTRCEPLNWLLLPYVLAVCLSVGWPGGLGGGLELLLLRFLGIFLTLAHVHYGVCVVRQMCDHFRINCFSIREKPPGDSEDPALSAGSLCSEQKPAFTNTSFFDEILDR